jgi:hypothetical protein
MRKDFFAQIRFRFAGKTVDVDAPAIAKKALKHCRQENQQWKIDQRDAAQLLLHGRIDAFLDEPGKRNARYIRADQGEHSKNELAPVAVDKKLDAKVVAVNRRYPI